jgi:hypothetical protein
VDVPRPEAEPEDGTGIVYTKDGGDKMNYFRMRVDLSHIEGKIYDMLYSSRAKKVSPQEKNLRTQRLQSALDKWKQMIPASFDVDLVAKTVTPTALVPLVMLYHSYLTSLVMLHGIYSHDADWVLRISAYSRMIGDSHATGDFETEPHRLPPGWALCVETSRSVMQLFNAAPPLDCVIW